MSDLAAAVFVITGLTAAGAYLTWWILKPPKQESQICDFCDIEGPHEPENIPYAGLDTHRELHQLGRELMKPFERLINWIETKLTRNPKYEPAGIIHYGSFTFQDYYAQATPHGTYHVWHHDEYLGEYKGQRIEIVEHLHAKDFPRTIEGSRATPEHHSVGGMTPHMCVCGKPLSQH